jgi:hypothetical protein
MRARRSGTRDSPPLWGPQEGAGYEPGHVRTSRMLFYIGCGAWEALLSE